MSEKNWQVYQLADLLQGIDPGELTYREFLRSRSLSCAIYHLPVGSRDMQTAHDEDELYLVLSGRARLRIDGEEYPVVKDTLMYVRASCDHVFFDIEEDLTVMAFFGTTVTRY